MKLEGLIIKWAHQVKTSNLKIKLPSYRWTRFSQKDPRMTSWMDLIPGPWPSWTSGTHSTKLLHLITLDPTFAGGSTWSPCLSRWAPPPASRWPQYSMWWTVHTTLASGQPNVFFLHFVRDFFQVNVSACCCCDERSPRYINSPASSETPYPGWL